MGRVSRKAETTERSHRVVSTRSSSGVRWVSSSPPPDITAITVMPSKYRIPLRPAILWN